jgi:tRNA pseudouridine38-40 synthase
MPRIKLKIEYDGTEYVGWQAQRNGVSIQGEIEESLKQIFNQEIKLYVAGRTDAGVHALGQVAHFDIENLSIETDKIFKALNFFL